jgi:hypothetical protein
MRAPRFRTKSHFLKGMDVASLLVPEEANGPNFTGTKLIATLGPACNSVETLCEMLDAGMSAGRVDLTWGSVEYHQGSLDNLQKVPAPKVNGGRSTCLLYLSLASRTSHPGAVGVLVSMLCVDGCPTAWRPCCSVDGHLRSAPTYYPRHAETTADPFRVAAGCWRLLTSVY